MASRKIKLMKSESETIISGSAVEDMKKEVEKAMETSKRLMASRVVPEEKLRRQITR